MGLGAESERRGRLRGEKRQESKDEWDIFSPDYPEHLEFFIWFK